MTDRPLHLSTIAWYSLAGGVLSAFIHGYRFGMGTHVAELPMVLRAVDPEYLVHDFYVNATEGFGPRTYFNALIATMARAVPLPWLYLILTCAGNAIINLVTGIAAQRLTRTAIAPLLAIALVTSVDGVMLGRNAHLFRENLTPSHLALPPALWALWQGLSGRPTRCALGAAVASIFHPTIAAELGALGLGGAVLRQPDWNSLRRSLFAAPLLLVPLALLWLVPYSGPRPDASWAFIESHFRHPHHALPGFFPLLDWTLMAIFTIAAGLAGRDLWRRNPDARPLLRAMVGVIAAIAVLWIGAYWFVERSPSPLWATARVYRLTVVWKWLGLTVLAVAATDAIRTRSWPSSWLPVAAFGQFYPVTALLGTAAHLRDRWQRNSLATRCVEASLFVGLVLSVFLPKAPQEATCLAALLLLAWLVARAKSEWHSAVLAMTACALVVSFFMVDRAIHLRGAPKWLRAPIITQDDAAKKLRGLAEFCRAETSEQAIFLVPPGLGQFRLSAERAILVDFHSFPFQADEAHEWKRRLEYLYGPTQTIGRPALAEMDERYRRDGPSIAPALQLGATYAVLYAETPTSAPVLWADGKYKVIRLEPEAISATEDARPATAVQSSKRSTDSRKARRTPAKLASPEGS
jgi:hypothetical protein